jgi:hypothetical protein
MVEEELGNDLEDEESVDLLSEVVQTLFMAREIAYNINDCAALLSVAAGFFELNQAIHNFDKFNSDKLSFGFGKVESETKEDE